MGDMNYRMNTTFREFNNDNVSAQALKLFPTLDQLTLTRKEDQTYPDYQEAEI